MKNGGPAFWCALSAVLFAAVSISADAQTYPTKPVKVIVAAAAGGAADITARLIAQALQDRLGQPFVVENRPGGGNNIGTELALRSAPDGYTLFAANTVNAINVSLYDKLPFDFLADIAPVGGVMRSLIVMQVHPSVKATSVPEFLALAKANPGKLNMGSGGVGSTGHAVGELFQMLTGTKLVHVPYRGEAPALTDQIGGHIDVTFTTMTSVLGYLQAGTLRPLAISTATRSPLLPDVAVMTDYLPGFEASSWIGVVAPKGTPGEIVGRLNAEINASLEQPALQKRFADMGAVTFPGSTEAFGKFLADDVAKWAKVVKFSGMKPN